jgi:hypothetical protein
VEKSAGSCDCRLVRDEIGASGATGGSIGCLAAVVMKVESSPGDLELNTCCIFRQKDCLIAVYCHLADISFDWTRPIALCQDNDDYHPSGDNKVSCL